MKNSARAIADLSEGTILATVDIEAPPEKVFSALTDPNELVKWWGSPDTYQTEEWVSELRAGGRWRAAGRGADGTPYAIEGEYLEVDPPRKLVQTWRYDWEPGHETTITYRLEAIASGTRVTLRHEGFVDHRESCEGHAVGWEKVLSWLAAHAETARVVHHFLLRLLPPRKTFSFDMSEAERAVMREHVGYWSKLVEDGVSIVFGPVADPAGGWGVGVVRVDDPARIAVLQAGDPAMRAGLGFSYEALPMPIAISRR